MPKTMLVADDSVVIQKSIGITFAQEDFDITYVNNGDEALTKAKEIKPDVILADVSMPQKDGYSVCDMVRKDPDLSAVPVLLLAGAHEPFDEQKGKTVGATGHVIKPFESEALISRVKEIVGGTGPAAEAAYETQPQPTTPPITANPNEGMAPAPNSTIAAGMPAAAPFTNPNEGTDAGVVEATPTFSLEEEIPAPSTNPAPPSSGGPAATIAGQSPSMDLRDAPMLDMEDSENVNVAEASPADAASDTAPIAESAPFEFSLDQDMGSAPPAATSEVSPPSTEASPSPAQDSGGDFWDLAGDLDAPSNADPNAGVDSSVAPADSTPVESPTPPANEAPAIDTMPREDFGFDLTADDNIAASMEDGAANQEFEISVEESGISPMGGDDQTIMRGDAVATPAEPNTIPPAPVEIETPAEPAAPITPIAADPAPVAATAASSSQFSDEQVERIVSQVFEKVIERIAWEVVPDLAERIIKEELARLTKDES